METTFGYHILLGLPLTPFAEGETAEYLESYRPDALEALVQQWQEQAEITRAPALETLDTADFFAKMSAYQQALAEQEEAAGTAPVESGGVG